ncbi:MAG TPA: 50S ribosomal protein L4 [Propionibacteriaceae bacterium]|nr:50S ribosomal protein L4 [Propionibacteriaceae bacterium]
MTETQSAPATSGPRVVEVLDAKGQPTGTTELPAHLFDVPANIPLIHQVVVAQLAAARQGTSKVKTRAEVRGGGTKPHRQKGTGRARQGSIRAPQYVGGGIVHGPTPRSYVQRTPKKMIAAALRGALSDRAREGRVHVVTDLVGSEFPSTKAVLSTLSAVATSRKVLVVIGRDEDAAWLSLRNVATVHAIAVDQLNAYDVLVNDEVVFTSDALDSFVARSVSRGATAPAVTGSAGAPDEIEEPTNAELSAETVAVEQFEEPTNAEPAAETVAVEEPTNAELAAQGDEEKA